MYYDIFLQTKASKESQKKYRQAARELEEQRRHQLKQQAQQRQQKQIESVPLGVDPSKSLEAPNVHQHVATSKTGSVASSQTRSVKFIPRSEKNFKEREKEFFKNLPLHPQVPKLSVINPSKLASHMNAPENDLQKVADRGDYSHDIAVIPRQIQEDTRSDDDIEVYNLLHRPAIAPIRVPPKKRIDDEVVPSPGVVIRPRIIHNEDDSMDDFEIMKQELTKKNDDDEEDYSDDDQEEEPKNSPDSQNADDTDSDAGLKAKDVVAAAEAEEVATHSASAEVKRPMFKKKIKTKADIRREKEEEERRCAEKLQALDQKRKLIIKRNVAAAVSTRRKSKNLRMESQENRPRNTQRDDLDDLATAHAGDAAASYHENDWISVPVASETSPSLEPYDVTTSLMKMRQYGERLQSRHQLPVQELPTVAASQPVTLQSNVRKARPKSAKTSSKNTRRSVTPTQRTRQASTRSTKRSQSAPRMSRSEPSRRQRSLNDDKENMCRKNNVVPLAKETPFLTGDDDVMVNYESDNDFIAVLNQDVSLQKTHIPCYDPSPVKALLQQHRAMDKEQRRLQQEMKKLHKSETVLGQAMQSANKNSKDALAALQKLTKAQEQLQQLSRDVEGLTQLRESHHDPIATLRASIASKLESIASEDIPASLRDSHSTVVSEPLSDVAEATQSLHGHLSVQRLSSSPAPTTSPPFKESPLPASPVPSPQHNPKRTAKYSADPLLDQQLGMQRDKQEILQRLMASSSSEHEHSDADMHFDMTKYDLPTVRFSNSSPDVDHRGTVEYDERHAQGDLIWNDKVFRLDSTGEMVEVPSQHAKEIASKLSLRNAGELAGVASFHHRSDDEESEETVSVESDVSDPNGLLSLVSRQIVELQEQKRRKELEEANAKRREELAVQLEEEYHQQRAAAEVSKEDEDISYWDRMLLESIRSNLEASITSSTPPQDDKAVQSSPVSEHVPTTAVNVSYELPKPVEVAVSLKQEKDASSPAETSSKREKLSGAELRLHLLNELQKMDDGFNYLLELSELEQNATVQTANDVMSRIVARAESESNRLLQMQQAEQMRHAHEMQLAATTTAAAVMAQEEKARVDAAMLELHAELQHHKMHTEQMMHVAQSSEAMSNLQHTAVLLEIEQKLQTGTAPASVTIGTNTEAEVVVTSIDMPSEQQRRKPDVSFQQSYADDFESSRYSETFEGESMHQSAVNLSHVSEEVDTGSSVAESIPESMPEDELSSSIEESGRYHSREKGGVGELSLQRSSVDESIDDYGIESYAQDSFATAEPSMSQSRISKRATVAKKDHSGSSTLFAEYKDQLASQKKQQEESIDLRLNILKKKLAYDLEQKKAKYSDSKMFAKEKNRLLAVFNEHCAELEKERWEVHARYYRDLRMFGETTTSSSDAVLTASTTESVHSPQRNSTVTSPIRSAVAAKLEASDSVLSFEVEEDIPDEVSEAISEEVSEEERYSDEEFEPEKSFVTKKEIPKVSTQKPRATASLPSKAVVTTDDLQQRYDVLARKRAEVEELLRHKNDDRARRLALVKIEEEERELEGYMRRVLEMDVEAELQAYRERAREEARRNILTAEAELKRTVPTKAVPASKAIAKAGPVPVALSTTKRVTPSASTFKADDTYDNDFEEIPDEVQEESYAEEISEEAAPSVQESIQESIDEQKESTSEVMSEEQQSTQEISSSSDRYANETFEKTAVSVSFKESIADYVDDFDDMSIDRQLSEPSIVEEVAIHEASTRSMDTIAELETSLDARRQRIDSLKKNIEKVQRDKRKLEVMRAKAKERELLLEEEAVLAQLLETEKGNYQAEKETILEAMKKQAEIAAAAAFEQHRIEAERRREEKEVTDKKAVEELMTELREPVEEEIAAMETEVDVEGDSWASDFGDKYNIVPVVMGNKVSQRVQEIESALKLQTVFRCHLARKRVSIMREERQRQLDAYVDTVASEAVDGDIVHESLAADVAEEIVMDDSFASSFSSSDEIPSMTEELEEKVAIMEEMVHKKDEIQAALVHESSIGDDAGEVGEKVESMEDDASAALEEDSYASHNKSVERLEHSRDTVAWHAPASGRVSEITVHSDGSHTIETVTTAGSLATLETNYSSNIHLEPLPITIHREIADESPRMKRPMTELSPVTAGVDSGGTVAGTIDTLETLESEESICEEEIIVEQQEKYSDIIVAGDQSEEEYTIEAYDDEFESFAAGDDEGFEETIAESIAESIPEDSSVEAPAQSPFPVSPEATSASPVAKVSPPEKHRDISQDSVLDISDDIPVDDLHTLEAMGDVVQEARKPNVSYIRDDEWSQSGDVSAPAEAITFPAHPVPIIECAAEEEVVVVQDTIEEDEVTPVVTPAATPSIHREYKEQHDTYSEDEVSYFSDKEADILMESGEEIPEESIEEVVTVDEQSKRDSIKDTAISPMNIEESDDNEQSAEKVDESLVDRIKDIEESDANDNEQSTEKVDECLVDRITDAIMHRMLRQESAAVQATFQSSTSSPESMPTTEAGQASPVTSPIVATSTPSPVKISSQDRPPTLESPPHSPHQTSPQSPEENKKTLSSLSDAPALFGAKSAAKEAVSPPSAAVSAVAEKIYAAAEETPQETWDRVTKVVIVIGSLCVMVLRNMFASFSIIRRLCPSLFRSCPNLFLTR